MSRKIRNLKYSPPVPSAIRLFFHGIHLIDVVALVLRKKRYINKIFFPLIPAGRPQRRTGCGIDEIIVGTLACFCENELRIKYRLGGANGTSDDHGSSR